MTDGFSFFRFENESFKVQVSREFKEEMEKTELDTVIFLLRRHLGSLNEIGLLLGDEKVSPDYELVENNLGLPIRWGSRVIRQVRKELHNFESLTSERCMDITRAGVIFAPDNYLFWNTRRRELANTRDTKKLEDEMQFLDTLTSLHPKREGLWIQRYWILRREVDHIDDEDIFRRILSRETQICTRAASLYRRNYYAWTHRLRVAKMAGSSRENFINNELTSLISFVKRNMSDYSAWNHRLQILVMNPTTSLIYAEYDLLNDLMKEYPTHESMWYHRRNLFDLFCSTITTKIQNRVHIEINFCNTLTMKTHHQQDYLLFLHKRKH